MEPSGRPARLYPGKSSLTPVSRQSHTSLKHTSFTPVSRKSRASLRHPLCPPIPHAARFLCPRPPRRKIYSDGEYNFKYYSGRRAWEVYRLLSPSLHLPDEYGEWRRDAPYPFSAPPDAKVP